MARNNIFKIVFLSLALLMAHTPMGLLWGGGKLHALNLMDYEPDILKKLNAEGKPFFLHFYADWCPTCRVQSNMLHKITTDADLNSQNPFVVLVVNIDEEPELKAKFSVQSQSVLIAIKNDKIIKKSISDTNFNNIIKFLQENGKL